MDVSIALAVCVELGVDIEVDVRVTESDCACVGDWLTDGVSDGEIEAVCVTLGVRVGDAVPLRLPV